MLISLLCALVRLTGLVCVSECIYLLMPEFNKGRLFVINVRKGGISISWDIDSVGRGPGLDRKIRSDPPSSVHVCVCLCVCGCVCVCVCLCVVVVCVCVQVLVCVGGIYLYTVCVCECVSASMCVCVCVCHDAC